MSVDVSERSSSIATSKPAASADTSDKAVAPLTWLEALVLSQVVAAAGRTAFDIMKIVGRSPVGAISASPGAIYPVVRRLSERGLIEPGDMANASRRASATGLVATAAGRAEVSRWAASVTAADALPYDAILSKVAALGTLAKAGRMQMLFEARMAVDAKLDDVEAALAVGPDDYFRLALEGAKAGLRAKRAWLESVIVQVAHD